MQAAADGRLQAWLGFFSLDGLDIPCATLVRLPTGWKVSLADVTCAMLSLGRTIDGVDVQGATGKSNSFYGL
jgi:hypothetical protein